MYNSDLTIVAGIISLLVLIVFFVMANRIGKILRILELFRDREFPKLKEMRTVTCENCKKEFQVSGAFEGVINCPHCRQANKITLLT